MASEPAATVGDHVEQTSVEVSDGTIRHGDSSPSSNLARGPVGDAEPGWDTAPDPVGVCLDDGLLWSPVDGKPKAHRQLVRIRNILADPRGSLLLDHYAAEWTQLWWLRIDIELRVLFLDIVSGAAREQVEGAVVALRAKYPQYRNTPLLQDPPTLIEMKPVGWRSWTAR